MRGRRVYPDEPAGPFPTPPRTVVDQEGREVAIRAIGADEGTVDRETAFEALVEMYLAFDPDDRAQGLPPIREHRVRDWVEEILDEGTHNLVAFVDDAAVGHATLVPDVGSHELAIFVLHDYQQAGVGTALIRTLLGHAAAEGIEHVWLTVERWNTPAINLYEKVGFETADAESFELEMAIRLAPDGDSR